MFRYVGDLRGNRTGATQEFLVKANTTVNKGDFVKIAAGYVEPASAGDKVLGVAEVKVVQGATATKKIPVVIATEGAIFRGIQDNVVTTFAQAHVGTAFDIVGDSGAHKIDTSSTDAAKGQVMAININPTGLNAAECDVIVLESQLNAFVQQT